MEKVTVAAAHDKSTKVSPRMEGKTNLLSVRDFGYRVSQHVDLRFS